MFETLLGNIINELSPFVEQNFMVFSIFLGDGKFPISWGQFKGVSEAGENSGYNGDGFNEHFNSSCCSCSYTFVSLKVK